MTFADPNYFWLLLLLIPLLIFYILRERRGAGAVRFSDISTLKDLPVPLTVRLRHILPLLRFIGITLLVVALARPQEGTTYEERTSEGVDIVMVLDVSTSMQALDFQPDNRLEVAKEQIKQFVDKRVQDRIGLVLFAGRSYTKCPLTMDYELLNSFVDSVDFGQIPDEGSTAIGTAIATAANRLKDSPVKSKIMILLTDGSNNAGDIPPDIAAKAAGTVGIKIYTIGVGRQGMVPYEIKVREPFTGRIVTQIQQRESNLDEAALERIASLTGGEFYQAQSSEELANIYTIIDEMEKTEITTKQYTRWVEKFFPWLIWGFAFLLFEFILRYTRFRRVP